MLVAAAPPGIKKYPPISVLHPFTLLHFYYHLTPQKLIRSLGPYGRQLFFRYLRKGFGNSHFKTIKDEVFIEYVYQLRYFKTYKHNTLSVGQGSGEVAFTNFTRIENNRLFVYSIEDELPNLKVPLLIVCGKKDFILPQCQTLFKKTISIPWEMKRLEVIPNAGHYIMMDATDDFNSAVTNVLRNCNIS